MRIRTDIWLVRVSAAALLIVLFLHGAPHLRDAFRYRSATLARIDLGIAMLLLATAVALDLALRRARQSSSTSQTGGRFPRIIAVVVLLTACSAALATGLQIGLFLYTITGGALFCLGLAATAAAVIRLAGDRLLATVGFAAVLYCAAAAAAFQIGAAPMVIALLSRT